MLIFVLAFSVYVKPNTYTPDRCLCIRERHIEHLFEKTNILYGHIVSLSDQNFYRLSNLPEFFSVLISVFKIIAPHKSKKNRFRNSKF